MPLAERRPDGVGQAGRGRVIPNLAFQQLSQRSDCAENGKKAGGFLVPITRRLFDPEGAEAGPVVLVHDLSPEP